MRDGWEAEAGKWAAFTRTPGHDSSHEDINLPALRELLPEPGHRTLDLGCGEGRVSRYLRSLGHRVAGADAAPTMVRLAAGHRDTAPADWVADWGGIQLAFHSEHRPIEAYSRAGDRGPADRGDQGDPGAGHGGRHQPWLARSYLAAVCHPRR
jgi:SAM-dependent methyltransferase